MAGNQAGDSKKRKHRPSAAPNGTEGTDSKRPKHVQKIKNDKKKLSGTKEQVKFIKKKAPLDQEKQVPMTKRELRMAAKEKTEARKKRRKPNYKLEKELAILWEKFRPRKDKYVGKAERSKLVSEALKKMHGKTHEIATSHVSSRILQSCVRFCSQAERDAIFDELRPHLLTVSSNVYSVHLVKKLLDNATKNQIEWFISFLHGHIASLLRHVVGSVVVEHAFQLGNAAQRRRLLLELYSTELQLFKDLTLSDKGRLVDIISKMGLQKSSVLQHMTLVIQPILEKGIVDHSIIHAFLVEYFSIADRSSAVDVVQQLSGPLLVRMTHTRDGSKVGILCVKHGSAKERKKIIKALKGLIGKIARDQYSCLVLISILSHVDDTKLLTKVLIHELQAVLKGLLLDKFGRRPILQLLHPQCQSYLTPDDLASLNLSIPSFCNQDKATKLTHEATLTKESSNIPGSGIEDSDTVNPVIAAATGTDSKKYSVDGGKKDPALRREELLINSGLAENIVDTCIDNAQELLFSHFGKDVVYEVAIGGADAILSEPLSERVEKLHEAIASLAALSKDESEEEHVFVNFHANRTIRKLILSCPAFATILWNSALKGRCEMWAQGHSLKVVSAYLESPHSEVKSLAKDELQSLVENNVVKVLDGKLVEMEH